MKRWFVRHAPVLVNGVCYGHADVPVVPVEQLTAHIHACVEAVASELGSLPLVVVSSPAVRCLELAEAVVERLRQATHTPVCLRTDERLRELHMGEWEGRSWTEIQETDEQRLRQWMESWATQAPPRGETPDALLLRVRDILSEQSAEEAWLVVTHAGVIRAHWVMNQGSSWSEAMTREVPHAVVVR
jgi:broad specificity phosphatase PhoE